MRFTAIENAYKLQAARGNLRDEHVGLMTTITVFELATNAFGEAFYGRTWDKAQADVANRRAATNAADMVDAVIEKWERRARDVANLPAALARETIVTTLDLPAVLGRARDLVIRPAEEPVSTESAIFEGANKTAFPNFRERPSLRKDLDLLGLFKQPEGTNVRYESFAWTEDQYAVAKYSRAIGYTWEARVNDDLASFLDEAAALGYAARLNRLRLLFAAIVAGTTRVTPTGLQPSGGTAAAGGPTIANIEYVTTTLAANKPPRRFGRVGIPINWEGLAKATQGNPYLPASSPPVVNPAYQTFTIDVEELMPEILAAAPSGNALDWLAYDANIGTWLEFARLNGFEGGPRIAFKLPDVRDTTDLGSFDNMTDAMKVVDVVGAKVIEPSKVLRIAGA